MCSRDISLDAATANARSEELAAKASYKHPWARDQRCTFPAQSFFGICCQTGKHVPWRFARPDNTPWGLAGLWNTWTDPASGEVIECHTLLTINADAHPLMNRMHRPDAKRLTELQDKRAVVPIEPDDVHACLSAPFEQAAKLVRLAANDGFCGEPA